MANIKKIHFLTLRFYHIKNFLTAVVVAVVVLVLAVVFVSFI